MHSDVFLYGKVEVHCENVIGQRYMTSVYVSLSIIFIWQVHNVSLAFGLVLDAKHLCCVVKYRQ